MPMVTRCPACAALFRVTPEQLQARNGQVRCGRCMTVFDGFAALATTVDLTPPESPGAAPVRAAAAVPSQEPDATLRAVPPPAAPASPAAADPVAPPTDDATADAPPTPAPVWEDDEVPPASTMPLPPQVRPASDYPPPHVQATPSGLGAVRAGMGASGIRADQSFLAQARATPRGASRAWSLGACAALLTLALQATYLHRAELASRFPPLRPALVQACSALGCTVPLPQQPRQINIEASDVQAVDPARPGVIELTATLRNHSGRDLGHPALDLVLTSTREHTLARRIFLPEEYLEHAADLDRGLAANAETTIRLVLDTADLGAAGFRLDLLPAPARK